MSDVPEDQQGDDIPPPMPPGGWPVEEPEPVYEQHPGVGMPDTPLMDD